ncbi:MAG TPA: hypothetical protein VGX23_13795 [Actinocrinis sp.]|nr:hypothetical protein [Actinocrinis sp.]
MTDQSTTPVDVLWRRIETRLATHAPAGLEHLNPAAAHDEIDAAERALGTLLPALGLRQRVGVRLLLCLRRARNPQGSNGSWAGFGWRCWLRVVVSVSDPRWPCRISE